MTLSMTELMRATRNAFVSGSAQGPWRVLGGVLTGPEPLRPGWIGVEGLGARLLDAEGRVDLPDGEIPGPVCLLDPPEDFLRLLEEINAHLAAGPAVTRRRESFGAYASETAYAPEAPAPWEALFRARLQPYRRMFMEVSL